MYIYITFFSSSRLLLLLLLLLLLPLFIALTLRWLATHVVFSSKRQRGRSPCIYYTTRVSHSKLKAASTQWGKKLSNLSVVTIMPDTHSSPHIRLVHLLYTSCLSLESVIFRPRLLLSRPASEAFISHVCFTAVCWNIDCSCCCQPLDRYCIKRRRRRRAEDNNINIFGKETCDSSSTAVDNGWHAAVGSVTQISMSLIGQQTLTVWLTLESLLLWQTHG